jgi:hypothetical protein
VRRRPPRRMTGPGKAAERFVWAGITSTNARPYEPFCGRLVSVCCLDDVTVGQS